ncbi:MAG: chromosomal replication initiator protein DnaA [Proteobacteria bacterium]|nr:chromosomal replication initiator protein DnaA [Pseudomonadota bacterium]
MLKRLEDQIEAEEYRRWLAPLKFYGESVEGLSIQVPNIFFKIWISEHYSAKMKKILFELGGRDMDLRFITVPNEAHSEDTPALSPNQATFASSESKDFESIESGLNDKYTFSNFVVGSSNQLAHAASMAVANMSAAYNPLFIYGDSGLGKTHLMNAVGNHLMSQNPKLKVVYMSSEQFTNELIEALRTERMSSFRKKYRNIDALLIDDIHFIGGKERTQEEFFYTFNALYEADRQIVLSSDRMPKDIRDLEDRLRSRFEGGLFADIGPPDHETKVAILAKKAEEEKIDLPTDVAFYLASQDETNIRVLEGYLARLGAYASLTNKPINLEAAQNLLGMFIEADQKIISLDLICKVTASFYNIKVSDLKSAKKQQVVAMPRQVAMYLARQMTQMSTIEIGQRFGGRDHSTVIHAAKKIENRIESDHGFARTISELDRTIRSAATRKDFSDGP